MAADNCDGGRRRRARMSSTRAVAWLEPRLQAEISSAERLLAVDAVLRAPVVMASPGPPANPSVVTGEITAVDRNSGKVDIRASDGSKVQLILPPLAVATTNKGDRASIDVTIGPAR
jgi:hypothetical protein